MVKKMVKLMCGFFICCAFKTTYNTLEIFDKHPSDEIVYFDGGEKEREGILPEYNSLTSFTSTHFSHKFFKNLTTNKLKNSMNNCGYTAIGMLLSYYDVYWSNDFIEEKYESNITSVRENTFEQNSTHDSPGVVDTLDSYNLNLMKELADDPNSVVKGMNREEALDILVMRAILKEINLDSFAGKLFSTALENNLIAHYFTLDSYEHNNKEEYIRSGMNEYSNGLGVSYNIVDGVLRNYINSNNKVNEHVSIETSWLVNNTVNEKRRIRNEIISYVKTGKPVLMGGNGYTDKNGNGVQDYYGKDDDRNEASYGHEVVAYYYDEINDILYGHMGRTSSGYNFYNLDNYFNVQISDYWCLSINKNLKRDYTTKYFISDKNYYYSPYENAKITAPITPKDYGYADSYPVDDETKQNFQSHKVTSDNPFDTRRYRTGYIQSEYIVMSCFREGINNAFIEYKFNYPVFGLIVDLAHWRSLSIEWLDKITGYGYFSIFGYRDYSNPFDTGGRLNIVDLLSDEINLSRVREKPTKLQIEFDQPVYNFKFNIGGNTYFNQNNRGRVCIGNMQLITERDYWYK